MNTMKVAVVMGGPSGEHEISLKSGHGVSQALTQRQFHVEPIVIPQHLSVPEACEFATGALRAAAVDVAFLALHGPFGEDGTIQHLCENLPLAYTGSDAVASRLGMDKIASRKRFEANGLAVPKWTLVDSGGSKATLPAGWSHPLSEAQRARVRKADTGLSDRAQGVGWSYPVVVKPVNQGSSLGVSIVPRPEGFAAAMGEAGRFGSSVLVEEFIQGREVTVSILGEEPLPVIEIRPHQPFFDFTAKYTPGATDYLVPAPLEPEVAMRVQAVALRAHQALGCRHMSRTDLILRADGVPVVLEVNTIPGFTPTSLLPKAAAHIGITYDALCEQLILMASHATIA